MEVESTDEKTSKLAPNMAPKLLYAQTLIVVVLIVVKFGGFLVIARNPPVGF